MSKVEEYLGKSIDNITLEEIIGLPKEVRYSIELNWLCEWAKGKPYVNLGEILVSFLNSGESQDESGGVIDKFMRIGYVTASKIQANYGCGYPTAIRIVNMLQDAGLVKEEIDARGVRRFVIIKQDKEKIANVIYSVIRLK